ncbi:hypothetical protein [Tabrizicola soli]|uniref:Uncharacterized protein n=1 Tax=Tabrizicola soli TaxID=2185115 RepID=A0ABV7DYB5_9RHOB|nr:hypothetical protein [Tabrizicola soli]
MIARASIFFFLCHPAGAETVSVKEISYAEVAETIPLVLDFERPAQVLGGLLVYPGLAIGERFAGQSLMARQDDMLVWHEVLEDSSPDAPLTALPAPAPGDLVFRHEGHWNSVALHGVGPGGVPGTGTLALSFDPPVCYLAFRSAIDGMSRFGEVNNTILRGKPEGSLNLRFFDVEGRLLANFMRSYNPEGPIAVGYIQSGQAEAMIAGVLLQNLDLGGVAIDDLRFDPLCPYKLF